MNDTKCNICPRKCNIYRDKTSGFCRESDTVRVARASLHMWEEPCISGTNGSGTVFFTGCNLRCVYCQNRKLSDGSVGLEVTIERLAEIFCKLKEQNAHNINMVTPTHFTLQIIRAIDIARKNGMDLPIVWNTSGYESVETIKMLDGYADIFLTDFKYMDSETARKYSSCPDYPEVAKAALHAMTEQTGEIEIGSDGIMKKGVIVRHLLLPGFEKESENVLSYLHSEFKDSIRISIMSQFTPTENLVNYPEINRKVTRYEYEKLVDFALSIGIDNAYIQEGGAAKESFIPDFDYTGLI